MIVKRLKIFFSKVRSFPHLKKTFVIFAIIVVVFLILRSQIFSISKITIKNLDIANSSDAIEIIHFNCIKKLHGSNIFSTDNDTVSELLYKCDPLIERVLVDKKLPSELIIEIEMVHPTMKIIDEENCYLVSESSRTVKLESNECSIYSVTEINTKYSEDIVFTLNTLNGIIALCKEENEPIPSSFQIIEEKDQKVIKALYPEYKVTFLSNRTPQSYVYIIRTTVKGLNERKERFKEIDIRFDRVIVK